MKKRNEEFKSIGRRSFITMSGGVLGAFALSQFTLREIAFGAQKDFIEASRRGDVDTVRRFLKAGIPVDAGVLDQHGMMEESALHVAADEGHIDVMTVLLAHGATVDNWGKGEWIQTPLLRARHFDAVRLLVEHGADVNATTKNIDDALYSVIMNHDTEEAFETFKYLLDRGATVTDLRGYETLVYLVIGGGVTNLTEFLRRGPLLFSEDGSSILEDAFLWLHDDILGDELCDRPPSVDQYVRSWNVIQAIKDEFSARGIAVEYPRTRSDRRMFEKVMSNPIVRSLANGTVLLRT